MSYKCPKCGDTKHLKITAKVSVHLIQDSDGNIQTVDDDANCDHEWDENSSMLCSACIWNGNVGDALVGGETETPEEHARDKARSEDFKFMVVCAAKGNMSMYHLLRDRSLDEKG